MNQFRIFGSLRILAAIGLILCAGQVYGASFARVLTLQELVDDGNLIIRGKVVGKEAAQEEMQFATEVVNEVFTVYRVAVSEVIKGSLAETEIEIFSWGGLLPNGDSHTWEGVTIEASIGDPVVAVLERDPVNKFFWTTYHAPSFFDERKVDGVTFLAPKNEQIYLAGEFAAAPAESPSERPSERPSTEGFPPRSAEHGISIQEFRSLAR